jgi:hypothetical protein
MFICPTGFRLQLCINIKITILKNSIFISIPHLFLFLFFPSSSISFSSILSPFRLHSLFLPIPFLPFLSFRYIHFTCARLSLSTHTTFCIFFPLLSSNTCFSLSSFPHLNFAIIFLLHFLSPGTPEFPLSYTSHTCCCIWIL